MYNINNIPITTEYFYERMNDIKRFKTPRIIVGGYQRFRGNAAFIFRVRFSVTMMMWSGDIGKLVSTRCHNPEVHNMNTHRHVKHENLCNEKQPLK
jgi:hypothetical protein